MTREQIILENMRYASPEVQEDWKWELEYITAQDEGDFETLMRLQEPEPEMSDREQWMHFFQSNLIMIDRAG